MFVVGFHNRKRHWRGNNRMCLKGSFDTQETGNILIMAVAVNVCCLIGFD